MVGMENHACGCCYDSSPAAWLHSCDYHKPEWEIYKTWKMLNSLVYRREQLACVNRDLYATTLDLLLEEQSDQGETARKIVQRLSDWEDEQRSDPAGRHEGEGSDQPVRPSTLVTRLLGLT